MSNATSIDLGHTHPSPLGAVASGRGASLRDLTAPMRLPRAYWRHKYTEPLCFDTTLLQGEFGSVKVHSVVLRRCSPRLGVGPMSGLAPPSSPYRDMMLVADNRGRIVHVTVALAAALGRSPDTLRAGGLDMIIPEPAAVLHGAWVQELANPQSTAHALMGPPPPFSCRSGMPICLAAVDEQDGPIVRPFRLEVKQRLTQAGSTKLHIVSAWPLSEEQALSQQRMRLTLDLAGNILSVDDGTPAELFGAPPHTFVGQSISEVVDLFRPEAGGSSAVRSAPSTPPLDGDVLDRVESALEASAARRVTRALLELSKRSLDAPGTSWRVGVTLPPDESARQELDQLALLLGASEHAAAERLIGGRTVPAVMRLRLVRKTQQAQQKRAVSMGFDVHEPRMEPLGSAFGGPPPSDADRSHHRAPSWGVQQAPWADKHSMRPGSVAAEPVAEGTRALHRRQAGPSAVAEATEEEMEEVLKHAESVANLQAPQPAAVDPSSAGTPRTAAASRLAAKVSALALEKSRSEAAGSPTGSMRAAALASSRAASRVNLRTSANDVPEAPAPAASRSIILPSPAAAASLAALAAGTSQRRSSQQLRLAGAEGSATVTEAASASAAASLGFESSLMVEVELWRADLLSGVVEVDEKGRLIRKDANSPLTHADLVLGLPATALLGVPAAEVLPLPPGGVAALLDNASGNQEVRGGLKRNGSARASKAGQPVVLPSRHAGDCCGIELRIQAVRRPGPPGSAYLILRPSAPAAAQPCFLRWLHDNDPSGLMPGLPGDKGTGGSGAQQEGGPLGLRLSVRGLVAAGRVAKLMRATAAANKAALLPPKASTTTGFEDRTPLLLAPSSPRARAGLTAVAREATTPPPGGQDALAGSTGADPSRDPPIPLPGTALAQPGPAPLSPAASRALSRVGSRLSLVAPAEPPPVPYARASLVPAGSVSRRQESLGLGNGLAAGVPDSLDTPRNNSGEQSWSLPPGEKTADLLKALEARKIDDERSQNPMDSIQSWVLAGAAAAAAAKGAEESSSSSKPSSPGSEGDCLSDDDMAAATHEADASKHLSESGAEEVESEAGAVTANYSAGKRFKRLNKLLISPMAHRPILVLRNITLALVAILLAAHLATFLLLRAELSLQTEHLEELVSAAQAARRVHELAINGRVLDMLYTGGFEVPGLPQFGEPLEEAVASLYEDILGLCDSFKALHHGVYLGFDHRRRISSQFGLRHIWDDPGLNVTVFYDAALITSANSTVTQLEAPLPVSRLMGLWDAGNEYLKQAFELHNNGEAHVRQGGNFTEWAAWKFIRANGLPVIFPAYLETLDALVQITVAESERIYQLQLIVLSVEGGLLCFMACVAMWIAASSFAHKRFMLYNVFVQIPMGVTRGLANMSIQLGAGEDDDDDELGLQTGLDPLGGGAADGGPPAEDAKPDGTTATQVLVSKPKERRANFGFASSTKVTKEGEPEGPVERTVSAIPGGSGKQGAATGGSAVGARLRGALSGLAFWRHSTKVNPEALSLKSRRRLEPSRRLCYIMVAPFLLWGILVVTINLADYIEMRTLASPIAALNVVNVFAIRFHRILFYVLEVAGALGYTARDAYKAVLRTEDAEWRLEYDVMLFGNEVVPAAGGAPPHFELAGTGLVFGGKEETTYLLFNTNQCLAEDAADCQPQDSPYYQATHHGLDVLVKNQATYVASLLQQPPEGSHINSTEFRFLWATGQTDAEGALNRLRDAYHAEVQSAYEGVKVQQVLLLALAWIWALVFVLLLLQPLLRRSRNEMRRIAELLSQLPGEVDCEGMVIAAISAGGAPLPAGAGGGAPMGGKGAKQGDRRRP
ncbi:hypothetical protein HYH03_013321 [Edaphochlamys debaryana]|uniref:PAS domain-containing protein n=1 Tax=Edaphochlamys debaryana TaxID=47281 RepID=A0A835XWL8_9CHLO|nr:hypothetical protein HYH03_013321 [Edaphochlamys debaryana]|eukprot:KAG2488180.1 hypothetical protein HYH03_013321 [Edaphochlamys debaryana]